MQGVDIAKASAAREKLLEAIQGLTESGEITWIPRRIGDGKRPFRPTRFFAYVHLVTDALGYIAFGFGALDNKLEFDISDAADKLSVAIAHQKGINYGSEGPDGTQVEYARELAARRANEQAG